MDEFRIKNQIIIDSAENTIATEREKIDEINKTINSLESEEEENIKRMEVYFSRKRRETGMDSPYTYISDYVKRLDTMSITEEINIKEGEILAKIKNSLCLNVRRTIEVLNNQIIEKSIDVRHVGETLKEQSKHHDKNNEHSEKLRQTLLGKFKTLVAEFADLKLKKYKTELRLQEREKAITNFVLYQKSQVPQLEKTIFYNLKYLPSDEEVVDHLIAEEKKKPGCVSPEENLEQTVIDFYQLIREREKKFKNVRQIEAIAYFIIKENEK